MKFRRRPVAQITIEATKFLGSDIRWGIVPSSYRHLVSDLHEQCQPYPITNLMLGQRCDECGWHYYKHGYLEHGGPFLGPLIVCPNDWIIRFDDGRVTAMGDVAFVEKYIPAGGAE